MVGGHRGGDDHGQESGGGAFAAQDSGAKEHASEHRNRRRGASVFGAAIRDFARRVQAPTQANRRLEWGTHRTRAHASPRSAKTGSNFTARRMAEALPAKVTKTAIARMMGKSTGSMEIWELKMERPI